jgi:hypothetical protein
MIALQKEFSMDRQLFGSYPSVEINADEVRCWLEAGNARVQVHIPAELLRLQRSNGGTPFVLRVPNHESIAVDIQPSLTESQQKHARRWSSEMEDFDRF